MICIRGGLIALLLGVVVAPAIAQPAHDPGSAQVSVDARTGAIAPAPQVQLTPQQKSVILEAVRPAEGRVKAPGNVRAAVGAEVPPSTELYFLPDEALASAPEAKGMKYTVAQNRVVLVDPTTMRVVDVIAP
jgi:hypothetical protein